MSDKAISVLGAGSWGTALAIRLARNGTPTLLWGRDQRQMQAMAESHSNERYLPGITFPEGLKPTADLEMALNRSKEILVVVPSHAFRSTIETIAPQVKQGIPLAWATKGLEPGSHKLLHQVVEEVLGKQHATTIISGPTFAREVAVGLPTAVTVASSSPEVADYFARLLHGETFRAYTCADVVGVEIGGAAKNVLAIAAGIADGLGFGANTRAALITRGLAEIMRLGTALGAQPETFMGLAGLGDLVLTCTDDQSRNRRVGLGLGKGGKLEEVITAIGQAVEGVKTAPEIHRLAQEHKIEMPISEQVYKVLYENLPPQQAVEALLLRELKAETE